MHYLGNKLEPTNTREYFRDYYIEKIPVVEIITYLNEKTKSNYKPGTCKTQEMIRARVREGYTEEDFKKVIDSKSEEWQHDSQMSKYLRPETLFWAKFESYLNQKPVKEPIKEPSYF